MMVQGWGGNEWFRGESPSVRHGRNPGQQTAHTWFPGLISLMCVHLYVCKMVVKARDVTCTSQLSFALFPSDRVSYEPEAKAGQ